MEIFNPEEWKRIKKCSTDEALAEIQKIRKQKNLMPFPTLSPTPKKFNRSIQLSSSKFNSLIGNGFSPGNVYLIYGAFATGKTQIGFHTCVSLYNLYKEMKIQISALFIDTEDTFRPERIHEIALNAYGMKDTSVFSRIGVLKATSTDMIFTLLRKIDSQGLDTEIKLIIIDSLTKHIRLDLGNDEISNTNVRDKLQKILSFLREITEK